MLYTLVMEKVRVVAKIIESTSNICKRIDANLGGGLLYFLVLVGGYCISLYFYVEKVYLRLIKRKFPAFIVVGLHFVSS